MAKIKRTLRSFVESRVEKVVLSLLDRRLDEILSVRSFPREVNSTQDGFEQYLELCLNEKPRVWGEMSKLHLDQTVQVANTLFNTSSGEIWLGEWSFTGHNVSLITGTHDARSFLSERQSLFPKSGGDIRIGRGVWIGSNATILGPCSIGDHAVVAAGSVVIPGSVFPDGALVAGVPAQIKKRIQNLPK